MAEKLCVNKACGKTYNDKDNYDGACRFHPGAPIFHEGLKGWSCCDKRFTDFSDFLAHPGCTTGLHTTERSEADLKAEAATAALATAVPDRAPIDPNIRLRSMDTKTVIPLTVSESLRTALAKVQEDTRKEEDAMEIKPGQPCTNNACKVQFAGPASNEETCRFHPGAPVFHEGMKYWSCCQKKKTHDFDEFLAMVGCTEGKHRWIRPKEDSAKAAQCRYDWFQSGSHVVLTVFAKLINPERSSIKANKDSITISLLFEQTNTFEIDLHLAENIVPAECTANLLSTKVDIKLKKAKDSNWAKLTA
eukprot:m.57997 g.57997  ORF g.57997 m.57997 type:complete len:305 (+) comp13504_c0_seq2:111-1025(+)